MRPLLGALLLLSLSPSALPGQAPDPARAARSAASRYETLLQDRAPYRAGGTGGPCDEEVGRFCLRFQGDAPDPPPEPLPPEVVAHRRAAIQAYRQWLSLDPGEPEAAGGLVHYLVEDGRAAEAAAAARTHARASPGAASQLLLGLTLHATGEFVGAEAAFDSARAVLSDTDRAALDDVRVLLEPRERSRYTDLSPEERAVYNRRLWAFSDPSLAAPGNERRSAHYARHAWVRVLEDAPRARGSLSWGDDHEEMLLRYGLPERYEKVRSPPHRLHSSSTLISTYAARSASFVPSALLSSGVSPPPVPGSTPELERDTVRSAYRPVVLHRMRGLVPQVTRIPTANGWILRVDAALPPDTVAPAVPEAPHGRLTILDTLGRPVARGGRVERLPDGTAVLRAEALHVAGTYVFQAEITDPATGLAGRAVHRIETAGTPFALSDPLVAPVPEGDPAGRHDLAPFPTATVPGTGDVYVWASVRGLERAGGRARYRVEWWLEPEEGVTALGAAVRWLGRVLGVVDDRGPVRLRWTAVSDSPGPVPIAFAVGLAGLEPGRYRLSLRVTDRVSRAAAMSYRVLLVEAPTAGR